MEKPENLVEKYPEFADVFNFIIKSRGLRDASELTPEFLKNAVAENANRNRADRERRGIRTMSPEERLQAKAKAYALIDKLAGPR